MIKRVAVIAAAVFVAGIAAARAEPPTAAPAAAEVKNSSGPMTPAMIYTADRLRDPFTASGGGGAGAGAGKPFTTEDFNIHNLSLRGIMKDSSADYALFSDTSFGVSFILRRGKLYDGKNKQIVGVTGAMNVKQKSARLITADGDVQIFRLGVEEDDTKQSD